MNSENKKAGFIGNSSIYLFSTIITFSIGILVLPIYTRYLSPGDFGIVVLFIMFGTMLTKILSASLHFASFRYYFNYKNKLEEYKILNSSNLIFILIVFTLFGILIHLLSDWLSLKLFDEKLTKQLIQLSFLSGCLEYLFQYMTALLTAQERAIPFAVITISRTILSAILSFYFIFKYSLTYMARINAMLITQGIIVFCLIAVTGYLFAAKFSLGSLKKSLKLSSPLMPNNLIGMIHNSFDKVMLNMYQGTFSVGYYSFGVRFSLILKMIIDSLNKVWEPFFMNLATENTEESKRAIIIRFNSLVFFYMVIGLCVIYFSEEMIKLLTTKEFYPSIYVVPIYVYFYLFSIIGVLTMPQISFSEKMIFVLPSTFIGALINVIFNILLIPKFGALGAAGGSAIAALFSQLINYYYAMKLFPLPLRAMKLVGLYCIIIIYTLFIYPIIAFEINVFIKIMLKIAIISTFVIIGIKFQFIEKSELNFLYKKVKLIN